MRDPAFQGISTRPPRGKVSLLADRLAIVRRLVGSIVQRLVGSIAQRPRPEHTTVLRPLLVPMASLQAAQRQRRVLNKWNVVKRNVRQRSVNMRDHPQRRAPKVEGTVRKLTPRLRVRRAVQPNSMAGLRNTNITSGLRFFRQQLEFFGSTRPVFA